MKIFFTASQRGKKYFDKYYKQISKTIDNLQHKQLDNTLINVPSKQFYGKLERTGRDGYIELYEKNNKCIHEADINIFETSIHSLSIGYMIDKSIELGKPTLVLYYKDNLAHFIEGIKSDKLIVKSYDDNNIENVIKDSIVEAGKLQDKRFNFFISPRLLDYVNIQSKNEGITKSALIRQLILAHMKNN